MLFESRLAACGGIASATYTQKRRKDGEDPTDHDFIRVDAKLLDHHTAIVGQSGSGKSFFLARLIEEILIFTQARCIILDPNGDFRLFREMAPKTDFERKLKESPGEIPVDEKVRRSWRLIDTKVYGRGERPPPNVSNWEKLKLPWPALPFDAITVKDDSAAVRDRLKNGHRFMQDISYLMAFKYKKEQTERTWDILQLGEEILNNARGSRSNNYESRLREELIKHFDILKIDADSKLQLTTPFLRQPIPIGKGKEDIFNDAITCARHFTLEAQERYSQQADKYQHYDIVETNVEKFVRKSRSGNGVGRKARVEVIDLPSFEEEEAKLATISGVLELMWRNAQLEWQNAQKGDRGLPAPTYVVIEEAHNLMPEKSDDFFAETVRDQFRRIAAEGRKYGLFLIICTQRPDKIDPLVVSECENIAIMKLGSPSVLGKAEKSLGLEGLKKSDLARCLDFKQGDALLAGPWAQPSQLLLLRGGLRRSKEGTKPMQERWATPMPEIRKILQSKP